MRILGQGFAKAVGDGVHVLDKRSAVVLPVAVRRQQNEDAELWERRQERFNRIAQRAAQGRGVQRVFRVVNRVVARKVVDSVGDGHDVQRGKVNRLDLGDRLFRVGGAVVVGERIILHRIVAAGDSRRQPVHGKCVPVPDVRPHATTSEGAVVHRRAGAPRDFG